MSRNMAEAPEEEPRQGPGSESAAASSGGTGLVVGVWIGAGVFILALAGLAAWGVNTVVGTASKMEAPDLSAAVSPAAVPVEGPFVAREVEPVAPASGAVETPRDSAAGLEPNSVGALAAQAAAEAANSAARNEAARRAANEAVAAASEPVVAPSTPPIVAAAEPVAKHDFTRLRRSH